MRTRRAWFALFLAATVCFMAGAAEAHGVAGNRFFPATLTIEDPFVADELSLPLVSHIKGPDGKETSIGAELSKTITPNLGVSVGAEYLLQDSDDESSRSGFGNPKIGLKYKLFQSDAHESVVSLGVSWEIGGTGSKSVGAESFSTIGPALFFGQGLGDLPEGLAFLRPLAVTGTVRANLPLKNGEANVLTYGFAIEYSLPYLQAHVKDVGLPSFFARLIPLVELAFETPIEGSDRGKTTGTVNPGMVWAGRFFEVGVEAIVPINSASGKNVGVRGLLHFFLDDLWPAVFRPIFQ